MASQRKASDRELQKLVQRLLRSNQSQAATPAIISGVREGQPTISTGRVVARAGANLSVLADKALDDGSAITVFLPEEAFLGEAVSCTRKGKKYALELLLIQYKAK